MNRWGIIDIFSKQKQQEDHSGVERLLRAILGTEEFMPYKDQLGVVLSDGEEELSDEEMELICAAGYGELRNGIKKNDKDRNVDI